MKTTALVVAGAFAATSGAAMAQDGLKSAPKAAKKLVKMSDAKLAKTVAGGGNGAFQTFIDVPGSYHIVCNRGNAFRINNRNAVNVCC